MANLIEQGGLIVYVLIALNIIGFTLMLVKFLSLWSFKSNIKDHALGIIRKIKSIESSPSLDQIRGFIEKKIFDQERGLGIIKIIASIAPLLGLLGTVWGIYSTFQVVAKSGLENPELFAGGISSALITTVAGLVVAIPHVVGFQLLSSKLDSLENQLEDVIIEMGVRKNS